MINNWEKITADEPQYRLKQIYRAWFDPKIKNYTEISTLPATLRTQLKNCPWLPIVNSIVHTSAVDDTAKALLTLSDGTCIETVLMGRTNKTSATPLTRYTVCVSTQVGCAMRCAFCTTGTLGFTRDLTTEEIVAQLRFWQDYLQKKNVENEIENMVLMGQGEPLANYENVKKALRIILDNTNIGPRQITVSTAGLKPMMEKIITDPDWPPVRFALSLHAATADTRKQLMPSTPEKFLEWLPEWAKKYHERFSSRAQFVGLEYIMLKGVNDDAKHLKALIKLASNLGRVRVNLIPYNFGAADYTSSDNDTILHWQEELNKRDIVATIRHSQGQDIWAACGQLANKETRLIGGQVKNQKLEN